MSCVFQQESYLPLHTALGARLRWRCHRVEAGPEELAERRLSRRGKKPSRRRRRGRRWAEVEKSIGFHLSHPEDSTLRVGRDHNRPDKPEAEELRDKIALRVTSRRQRGLDPLVPDLALRVTGRPGEQGSTPRKKLRGGPRPAKPKSQKPSRVRRATARHETRVRDLPPPYTSLPMAQPVYRSWAGSDRVDLGFDVAYVERTHAEYQQRVPLQSVAGDESIGDWYRRLQREDYIRRGLNPDGSSRRGGRSNRRSRGRGRR